MVSQYNTRRKSLSLPSLGIALPGRSVRSPPSDGQHVAKRQKRSHSGSTSSSSPLSPPRLSTLRFDDKSSAGRVPDSPPPSPGGVATKVDTQGIDDIIVVGVIEQLEKTGNRPHLLKELAHVLSPTIPIVESSANPAAIISSRLATYLKRNWSALSRCPLDKKLVGTHPKRVYYFLTTSPHQPIPEDAGTLPAAARIISPSLSSAASSDNDADSHARDVRSPSPELDLSDYDDAPATDPFTTTPHPPPSHNIAHNRRAQSPPLEIDEREFTRTASSLQERRRSAQAERERSSTGVEMPAQRPDVAMMDGIPELVETEESAARKNEETAAALFGAVQRAAFEPLLAVSSPLMRPALVVEMPVTVVAGEEDDWAMKSPEHIELDELDDLFGGY